MPYKIIEDRSKNGYCVHKENPDGSRGKRMGCHASEKEARAQMRALYAAETKEGPMSDADHHEKMSDHDYTAALDFEEYEAEKEVQETAYEIHETAEQVAKFAKNISYSDDPDKPGRLVRMFDQAKSRLSELFNGEVKAIEPETDDPTKAQSSLLITKNKDGRYVWIARYSNNARDVDNPPEIIAAKSHQRFVEMVDKGLYPMPELWIWHVKEWKIGEATVLDFDAETGFAIAAGYIDKDKHALAKDIAAIDPTKLRVSHGMPNGSIVRDNQDPSVIIEHQSAEISVLPAWSAANPLTGFVLNAQKEINMIDPKKAQDIENLGVGADNLSAVEAANQADKEVVETSNIETKEKAAEAETVETAEVTETETEPAPAAETPAEAPAEVEETEAPAPEGLQVADVAEAIKAYVDPLVKQNAELIARLTELDDQVKALTATDEAKIAKEAAQTPRASLLDMLGSAIGSTETVVDGRTKEGKDGPKETQVEKSSNSIGIPFINDPDNWRDSIKEINQ